MGVEHQAPSIPACPAGPHETFGPQGPAIPVPAAPQAPTVPNFSLDPILCLRYHPPVCSVTIGIV